MRERRGGITSTVLTAGERSHPPWPAYVSSAFCVASPVFVAKRFSTYGRGTSGRAIGLRDFEGRPRDDLRYCPVIGKSLFQMSAKSFHWSFCRFHTTMNFPVSTLPSLKVILYVPT